MNAKQARSIRLGILRARKEIDHQVVVGDLPSKLAWEAHETTWNNHHERWSDANFGSTPEGRL